MAQDGRRVINELETKDESSKLQKLKVLEELSTFRIAEIAERELPHLS